MVILRSQATWLFMVLCLFRPTRVSTPCWPSGRGSAVAWPRVVAALAHGRLRAATPRWNWEGGGLLSSPLPSPARPATCPPLWALWAGECVFVVPGLSTASARLPVVSLVVVVVWLGWPCAGPGFRVGGQCVTQLEPPDSEGSKRGRRGRNVAWHFASL